MTNSLLSLSGRVALVVGAGKGIGRATAHALARAGAHTVVLDRHQDLADAVVEEIRSRDGLASALCADLTDYAAIEPALAEADAHAGGLDVLVNITGSATWRPILDLDHGTWARDFAVNLDQHLHVSRQMVGRFKTSGRGGVICVVASISGLFGSPGHAAYGAAKAGLLSFVRSAGEEWWPLGVRINAVVPGSVRTPRIEQTLMKPASASIPAEMLARMATPEDVAGPIVYLVSDLARKVTGQTIVVDGGTSTRFPYSLT